MNASLSIYVLETMKSFDTLQLEILYTTYKVEKWVASKRKYRLVKHTVQGPHRLRGHFLPACCDDPRTFRASPT